MVPTKANRAWWWTGGGLLIFLSLVLYLIVGGGKNRLPGDDRNREFGEDAFIVILQVDPQNPSEFEYDGVVAIKDGKMASTMPGAVLVVGFSGPVMIGGKTFTSRQIILLTSKREYILAPPGMTITIPGDVEVFGRTYKAKKFTVPKDSMLPDTL